jgi:glycosyltransferase involved in cell wall biosynthesis
MAMARCIIGSVVGGIRELIRDGETGLVFEAQSQAALEAKLGLLLSGQLDAGALGERARSQVVAQRQWRHMAMAYEAAYRQAALRLAPRAEGRPG